MSWDFTLLAHFAVFQVLPYVVIVILFVASFLRWVLAPYSWKSQSSELLDRHQIWWGANFFHLGVILLFCGHCFGLFMPEGWLVAMGLTPPVHQFVEIVMGGGACVIALIGLTLLTYRRLTNERVRVSSRKSDFLVLVLLYCVILLGGACVVDSAIYDHSGATIVLFGTYVKMLMTLHPDAWKLMLVAPDWQKWHIFFGLMVFLAVPFTRLVHIWSGYLTPLYLLRPHGIMRARGGQVMR